MKKFDLNNIKETDINLIPKSTTPTGSYICTWWCQNSAANDLNNDSNGSSKIRDALNQEFIFDEEKYYHPQKKEDRADLIFLLDDGWDIPIGAHDDGGHNFYYGSVDPDSVKFARFGNTPEERLKGMSDKTKEMGYAGLGLWISPQECGREEFKTESPREYWETRARWCDYAGILYWKVDWGAHDYDDDYRRLISECAKKYAPNLLVEHAVVQKPLTHNNHNSEFISERIARVSKLMTFSDVYRTYDVTEPFENVCTLGRAHEALVCANIPEDKEIRGKGLINGENLYSISAALGLTVGIMNYNKNAAACINWHRISPPFGIRSAPYIYSEEMLTDSLFCESELCTWAPCYSMTVEETAPAIMARNCPLPIVSTCDAHAPFIVASKNPVTNAYSVASVCRTVDPNPNAAFPSNVTLLEVDPNFSVGVFGLYNSLTLSLTEPLGDSYSILAQDMLSDAALDVTQYVTAKDNCITIDGKLLRIIGKWTRGHRDYSDPSLVLKIYK